MEKMLLPDGNYSYMGSCLGFNYSIEKKDDVEFKAWLKAKLKRYLLSSLELEVLKEILAEP